MTVCGVQAGAEIAIADPSQDVVLQAVARFGGILLTYNYPTVNPHAVAYTRVFRSLSDDPVTKTEIAVINQDSYFDRMDVAAPTLYHYWIEVVSVNGTPFLVGPASALTQTPISYLSDELAGNVTQGLLSTALQSDIAATQLLGDTLLTERLARMAGDQSITDLAVAIQAALDEINAAVLAEETARINADAVMTTEVQAMVTRAGDTTAALTTETTTRIAEDDYEVGLLDAAQVSSGNNAAAIANESTIRSSEDGVLVSRKGTLQLKWDNDAGQIQTIQTIRPDLTAEYSVKLDVNGRITGYGLYNDGATSEFAVQADVFSVGSASAPEQIPFIVDNNEVFLNSPLIDYAFIDQGHFTDVTIDTVHIADDAVSKFSSGFVATETLLTTTSWVTLSSLTHLGTGRLAQVALYLNYSVADSDYSQWLNLQLKVGSTLIWENETLLRSEADSWDSVYICLERLSTHNITDTFTLTGSLKYDPAGGYSDIRVRNIGIQILERKR